VLYGLRIMEKLPEKTDSKKGDILYRPLTSFAHTLKQIARRARLAPDRGVYTEAPDSRVQYYDFTILDRIKFFEFDNPKPHEFLYQKIQKCREVCAKDHTGNSISEAEYKSKMDALNAIEKTVRKILKDYSGYSLWAFDAKSTKASYAGSDYDFHKDRRIRNRNTIILCVTPDGPSTVYEDENGKLVMLPDNSMTGHAGRGITHSSPKYRYKKRVTFVIGLCSNIQTRRH
jgi:hypothetical protein